MKTSQITFLGLALFITLQLTAGNHLSNCGLGQGTDVCGCSSFKVKAAPSPRPGKLVDPEVIYEVSHMKKNPTYYGCGSLHSSHSRKTSGPSVVDLLKSNCGPIAPRFRPVGDLCAECKTEVAGVIPAYPGKPQCNSCAQKASKWESGLSDPGQARQYISFSNGNTDLNTFDDDCLSFDEQENIYNSQGVASVPADPVSLSLAFKMAQKTMNRPISEASLNFGAKSTPVDGSVKKMASNIPEEKLFTIEKPLVELKFAPQSTARENYDDLIAEQEALEQKRLELEAQAEERSQVQGFISYGELGYAPVTSTGNQFVNTEQMGQPEVRYDDAPCGPLGPPMPGYQRGNVIIRSDPAQQSEEENSSEDEYYGADSYEESDSSASYSFEDTKPCNEATGFLARLRASARAQNKRGCGCGN